MGLYLVLMSCREPVCDLLLISKLVWRTDMFMSYDIWRHDSSDAELHVMPVLGISTTVRQTQ